MGRAGGIAPWIGVLLLSWGCGVTPIVSQRLTLRVASDLENPPFAYLDEDQSPSGRDVVMMQAIGERLGRNVVWVTMAFPDLLPAVERGEADVVCATLGITPERQKRVLFTRPYFDTVLAVVVRNGPGEPRTLAELSGRRVYGGQGTTSERAIRAALTEAIGVFEPEGDLPTHELLRQKKIDAAVMDGPAAEALIAGSWGLLRILDENLGREHYALALGREEHGLRELLDAALEALEASGKLAEWNREFGLE